MLTAIDHIGIAVYDLDVATSWYSETLGAEDVHRERVEADAVEEVLLTVGEGFVQLLSPTREDSPVGKFLALRGEGLHHVAYRVNDCAAALTAAIDRGARPVDLVPRPGSRGTTVAFLHPRTAFGTLIELVQIEPLG